MFFSKGVNENKYEIIQNKGEYMIINSFENVCVKEDIFK